MTDVYSLNKLNDELITIQNNLVDYLDVKDQITKPYLFDIYSYDDKIKENKYDINSAINNIQKDIDKLKIIDLIIINKKFCDDYDIKYTIEQLYAECVELYKQLNIMYEEITSFI